MTTMRASEKSSERRTGTQRLVDNLLVERQQMLVLYSRVAGLEPFNEDGPVDGTLREFKQILVDYIAAAHFGLYERIVGGRERRQGVLKLAESLYPRIAQCTDVAVTFNDKYEVPFDDALTEEFSTDLSRLGEHLAERIELEDQLINEMLS